MNKLILFAFGLLIASGGYLYYQNETATDSESKRPVFDEAYQLEESATPTPAAPKEPSERALKASIGVFLLLNEQQEETYLDDFSENDDIKEAVTNLALLLDSDDTKLSKAENIISSSQVSQPNSYENTKPSSNTANYNSDYEDDDYSYSYDYKDSYGSSNYDYLNDSSDSSEDDD